MDQKSLYEQQTGGEASIRVDSDPALIARDRFISGEIATRVGTTQPFDAAELSVGEGRLSLSLLKRFPGMRLDGIDISTARIAHVRALLERELELGDERTQFIECNFDTQFGIIDNIRYDFVIALDIMEHVLDVFGFVEHCRRILKQDGILFLRVPNIAYIKHRLRLFKGKMPVTASWFGPVDHFDAWREQYGWDGGHLHLFTIPVLYQLLSEQGFSVELCRDPGTSLEKLRNWWPNLLYSNPLIIARKTGN